MDGTTMYPLNFSNRRGIPMIESNNVVSDGTNVVVTIGNGAFRWLNGKGLILFRLQTAIAESAAALPVVFSSNGITQPLTMVGGEAATGEYLTGTGVYLIYYSKDANLLQLMTVGPTTATTTTEG